MTYGSATTEHIPDSNTIIGSPFYHIPSNTGFHLSTLVYT